jgi:uncharacterized glyoxalase superfamily protein PhnB
MSDNLQIYDYPQKEIWAYDKGNLVVHRVTDTTEAARAAYNRKKEIGNGITLHGEFRENFDAPAEVVLTDPDGIEWFHTRSKTAKRRFILKYPQFVCVEGGI